MGLFSRFAQSSERLVSRRSAVRRNTVGILIVEDEPLVAFDNEHALAQAGYRVVDTVDRYDHAVVAMEAGGIDLVIADIRLSTGPDGVEVARHAGTLAIPVLFSAGACPQRAADHAVAWLAKPYAPRDLVRAIAVVDAVLAGRRPRGVPEAMTIFPVPPE